MAASRISQPLQVGPLSLKHRMVMAPLTRFRATDDNLPGPYAKEYYSQRASVPGTLLITEATFVSPRAGGYPNIPGIWNQSQINGWKEITEAVHAKGSYIFLQIWALGRVAPAAVLKQKGFKLVSSSPVALDAEHEAPEALTVDEIKEYVQDFAQAAKNAIEAGFDGVEIHGANGYLVDQFWQDVVNQRTDAYGGSIEKRARFGLEVARAVVDAVGDSKRVGMRLSPFSTFQGMKMADPIPQFLYIVQQLKRLNLAYLHLVESRVSGSSGDGVYLDVNTENDALVKEWGRAGALILAGGFTADKAKKVVSDVYQGDNVAIAFGRLFISTPDLPFRIQNGLKLNEYERKTFYAPKIPDGYIDYPFSQEWLAQSQTGVKA